MSCTHRTEEYWVEEHVYDDWDGNPVYEGRWKGGGFSTVDLDTHRYKCTRCGEVMYYSGRAKAFYEKGEGELLS